MIKTANRNIEESIKSGRSIEPLAEVAPNLAPPRLPERARENRRRARRCILNMLRRDLLGDSF
jgi:hypothetical protein